MTNWRTLLLELLIFENIFKRPCQFHNEFMEYQKDKNQACAVGFLSFALTISAYFLPVCTWSDVYTDKWLLCLKQNVAVPPFCSFHFSLVSPVLEKTVPSAWLLKALYTKMTMLSATQARPTPRSRLRSLSVPPSRFITFQTHGAFLLFCFILLKWKKFLYFWGVRRHFFVKGE